MDVSCMQGNHLCSHGVLCDVRETERFHTPGLTMDGSLLLYIGALLPFGWGVAHLFPTRNVVHAFGNISADNRRIVTMEWILEGVSLIFIGALVALVTYVDHTSVVSRAVYWAAFGLLNIFSVISLFTGFRNSFIAFKLCPLIFSGSSIFILAGCLAGSC